MFKTVAGQWIGTAANGASQIIIDLDDGPDDVRGSARIFFDDGSPGAICDVVLPRVLGTQQLQRPVYWMPASQATMVDTNRIRELYPDHRFSETASLRLERLGDALSVCWETDVGTVGNAVLKRKDMKAASAIDSQVMTWGQFKDFALSSSHGTRLFRGQPEPYKLRTAFHRTYRKDLIRYVAEDIPVAHRQLTARTQHLFNLQNPLEEGAFWNLLQHHGYPTPLLDWTYSPFVAAFFAYRRRKPSASTSEHVRIFAFERADWIAHYQQLNAVNFARPHFSVLEALAVENPRAIPQQAVSTLTNVDDIEAYLHEKERDSGKRYIHAIDLSGENRPYVMAELSLMGITAGSLFPGLDGACEELMGKFFHHQVPPRLD